MFVALNGNNPKEVLGYICASPDTNKDDELFKENPYLSIFQDLYETYPAHLHINCHANARGKGVGEKLLQTLEEKLRHNGLKGLHLITSPQAQNVNFYHKYGFSEDYKRTNGRRNCLLQRSSTKTVSLYGKP